MKLLRDFFRLRFAGRRVASVGHDFRVTVPAPLSPPAPTAVVVELPRASASTARREPASFLKAPRHRRFGSVR